MLGLQDTSGRLLENFWQLGLVLGGQAGTQICMGYVRNWWFAVRWVRTQVAPVLRRETDSWRAAVTTTQGVPLPAGRGSGFEAEGKFQTSRLSEAQPQNDTVPA